MATLSAPVIEKLAKHLRDRGAAEYIAEAVEAAGADGTISADDNGLLVLAASGETVRIPGLLELSSTNAVTAFATGGQTSATQLTTGFNRIATCATAGDSVKLPTSAAGRMVVVWNAGAASAQVFGAGTDTINSVATATGVPQAINTLVVYHCFAAGNWIATAPLHMAANTAISTVGAGTLTAAAIVGGVITRSGSTAAYTDTTATAAQIVAAVPTPRVGLSWILTIKNTVAFTQTLAAGTNVTLSGQTVIPGLATAQFLVTLTSLTAVSIQGLGVYQTSSLPASKFTTTAAASPLVASAGDLTGADHVYFQVTTNGAFSLTTRTAAEMFGDIPNAQIGQSYLLTIVSQGDNTVTVTGGSNVTITGTATVATKVSRTFVATFTSATALTLQSVSKGTIE